MKGFLNRLMGCYTLLTSRRWVVMAYNNSQDGVTSYFNVTLDGFRALVEVTDAVYEQIEAQDAVLEEVNKILEK